MEVNFHIGGCAWDAFHKDGVLNDFIIIVQIFGDLLFLLLSCHLVGEGMDAGP